MFIEGAVSPPPELKPNEFEMIRQLAMKTFGLDLRAGKERLVAARLTKHLRAGGFRSFRQYYDKVRCDDSGELLVELINALTTNHTSFLREPSHFDFFESFCALTIARADEWIFGPQRVRQGRSHTRSCSAYCLQTGCRRRIFVFSVPTSQPGSFRSHVRPSTLASGYPRCRRSGPNAFSKLRRKTQPTSCVSNRSCVIASHSNESISSKHFR